MDRAIYLDGIGMLELLCNHEPNSYIWKKNQKIYYFLFYEALRIKDYEKVEWLLSHVIDPNYYDGAYLREDVFFGHEKLVALLLRYGARVKSLFLIYDALDRGFYSISEMLIDFIDDKNLNKKLRGTTLLQVASAKNQPKIFALLLENNADPNIRDDNGVAPLHRAAQNNWLELMDILLQYSADVDAKDYNGFTPLYYVIDHANPKIVFKLCEAKTDVNLCDYLMQAMLKTDRFGAFNNIMEKEKYNKKIEKICKFIIDSGADVNKKNDRGYSPLDYLAMQSSLIFEETRISLLIHAIRNGADPNFNGYRGSLLDTDGIENFELGKCLLEHGVDPKSYDPTRLDYNDNIEKEMVKLLLANGARKEIVFDYSCYLFKNGKEGIFDDSGILVDINCLFNCLPFQTYEERVKESVPFVLEHWVYSICDTQGYQHDVFPLPPELIEGILDNLNLSDAFSFICICKELMIDWICTIYNRAPAYRVIAFIKRHDPDKLPPLRTFDEALKIMQTSKE